VVSEKRRGRDLTRARSKKPQRSQDTIFALRPERIRLGDIILTAGSGLISRSIRKLTKSNFSHAALCTRPSMLLEALYTGVQRRSTIGTYATQREWIAVLRPKKALTPDAPERLHNAELAYGHAYSVRGAIASRFSRFGATPDRGVFCSQVVADAYLRYGVSLIPGKSPAEIYPGMLLDSPELSDVTDKCVRKLGSESDTDLYKLVVATGGQALPEEEMRMNRRAFEAIRRTLGRKLPERIRSLPELATWLSTEFRSEAAKQADLVVLKVLDRAGMFKWYDEFHTESGKQIVALEWAAEAAEISKGKRSSEIEAFLRDLGDSAQLRQASLQGRRATAREYRNLARTTGLKYFQCFDAIYGRQYQDAKRRHKAIDRMIAALKRRPPT